MDRRSTMIPPYGESASTVAWVDRRRQLHVWCFTHYPTRPLSTTSSTPCATGRHPWVDSRPSEVVNKDNDYMIDRAFEAGKSYCGVAGIAMQDAAIRKHGPIGTAAGDLVSTDNGVILARSRLRRAALAVGRRRARRHRPAAMRCARPRSCCRTTSASTRPRPALGRRRSGAYLGVSDGKIARRQQDFKREKIGERGKAYIAVGLAPRYRGSR
jgi:hypothetical protein